MVKKLVQKCASFFVGKFRNYNLFALQLYADERV